jgi:hypothetical protein
MSIGTPASQRNVGVNVTRYKLIALLFPQRCRWRARCMRKFLRAGGEKVLITNILLIWCLSLWAVGQHPCSISAAALHTILPELLRGFSDYRMWCMLSCSL